MSFLGRTPSNAPLTTADIPDGIIVAADLAPNSVDSSELVDGSIDTSHLSSSLTLTTPNLGTPSAVTLTNATFPAGHVIQTVTSTIEGGSRGHNTKLVADRSEIHADYRSSIIPIKTGSKILIRYTSRGSYVNNTFAGFALGYEVTASGGTATASTLKDNLTSGANDDENSYFKIHTTSGGGGYRALTLEDFHTPSYTLGQKIWYGVISYSTGWHYFELNGDITIIISEIAG